MHPAPVKILQHTDHSRIIVSQNIQLQQVVVNGMVIKMGGHNIRRHIVGRMLHRGKGMDRPLPEEAR